MRVYISGPMSGIENNNREAFMAAAAEWRGAGHDVVNPIELSEPEGDEVPTWKRYLARDLSLMCACDEVAVLPGWDRSRGARLEVVVALELGIPIIDGPGKQSMECNLGISRAASASTLELARATDRYGQFASAHEGLAVIWEEFEELRAEVFKKKPDIQALSEEATQLAAMSMRFLMDVVYAKEEVEE